MTQATLNPAAEALETAAALLLARAAELRGQPVPTTSGFDPNDWRTWWPAMLAQFASDSRPHAWRDPGFGVPITETGDNDPVDEELLRTFKPFHDAATREGVEDSKGERFYLPTIKKRAGLGPQASGVIRDETRRLWESAWGEDWRAAQANIDAGFVPSAEKVARIFGKVYG